jgi:hypothetical protein
MATGLVYYMICNTCLISERVLFYSVLQTERFQDTIRKYRERYLREHGGREPVLEPYHVVQQRYAPYLCKYYNLVKLTEFFPQFHVIVFPNLHNNCCKTDVTLDV